MEEELVGGEGFAVDGSLITADANRQSGIEGATWTVPEKANRAVKEYVAALDDVAFGWVRLYNLKRRQSTLSHFSPDHFETKLGPA